MTHYDTYKVRRAEDNATLVSFNRKQEAIRYADRTAEQMGLRLIVVDTQNNEVYVT